MTESKNPYPSHHWSQQSPISLSKSETLFVKFPGSFLKFDYRGGPFAGRFEGETGHRNFVLSVLPAGQTPPTVTIGSVQAQLVKIHLHTPSEHDVEGKNHGGEIHLIHEIANPAAGSELIVVGIFFNESEVSSESEFFSTWATHSNKPLKAHSEVMTQIDPRKLLPKTDKWYRYEGSLTSEPFSEHVSWLVLDDSVGVTSSDFRKLKKHAHQPERPVQAINRRYVIRNFQ